MVFVVTVAPPQQASRRARRRARRDARRRRGAAVGPGRVRRVREALQPRPAAKPQTVEAEIGRPRRARSSKAPCIDSVALGDLSMNDVEPGVPARFELLADTPGAYPLVLVNENRRIGTLEIR